MIPYTNDLNQYGKWLDKHQRDIAKIKIKKFKKSDHGYKLSPDEQEYVDSISPVGEIYTGDIFDLTSPRQQKKFYDLLHSTVIQFVYVKANGELREAFGTLNMDIVNKINSISGDTNHYTASMLTKALAKWGTRELCCYYDIQAIGFRKFFDWGFVKIISLVDPDKHMNLL